MDKQEQAQQNDRGVQRSLVVQIALISEGALTIIAILWAIATSHKLSLYPSFNGIGLGLLATLPMLIINIGIFEVLARGKKYAIYERFKREIIKPLCANLNISSIALVALSSGIGEELFFRGMLNIQLSEWFSNLLGIALSSFLFAYVHFIGMLRVYWRLLIFYVFFGLYFSSIVYLSHNLVPCIVAHATYNFFAMTYVRYFDKDLSC